MDRIIDDFKLGLGFGYAMFEFYLIIFIIILILGGLTLLPSGDWWW